MNVAVDLTLHASNYSTNEHCGLHATNRNHLSSYEKGISAEICAANELVSKGYEILGKRIKIKYGEIDLLAKRGQDVVAVEVKQRKTLNSSRDCISLKQRKRIVNAFLSIISDRNELFENYRIDVVCLDSVGRFEHIENAFCIEDFMSA